MRTAYLPDDHRAMFLRRFKNDAEIKALKADLVALDKKRKPIQIKIATIRCRMMRDQLAKYKAETELRRQRKAARRELGQTGEAKTPETSTTVSQLIATAATERIL